MKKNETIKKLRECAKGLLDVAREMQSSERMESPMTLEIVARQIKAKDGKAHGFCLPFVVGVDEFGDDVVLELARLPHVLIGGAIGQGKTMCLNSLIVSLVAAKTPSEVQLIVFDPKCVEYTGLVDLPHLTMPPVTSVEKMEEAILWLESEVDRRLQMFANVKCRNISQFNGRKQALASEDLREHQDMAILLLSSTHYKSDPTSSVRAWDSELIVYSSAFKRHTSHRRRGALESRWNADARCARFGTPLQLSTTIKFSRIRKTIALQRYALFLRDSLTRLPKERPHYTKKPPQVARRF